MPALRAATLLLAAAAPAALLATKPQLDWSTTAFWFPVAKATVKLKIGGKGQKVTGELASSVVLDAEGGYELLLDGEAYEHGLYQHPAPTARKVLLEPDPAAIAAILAEEEAGLEASAAQEGLALDFTLGDMPLHDATLSAKLYPKAGEARVRLRYRFVATGTVSGEGLVDAPVTLRVRYAGLGDPVPLSDLVVDP